MRFSLALLISLVSLCACESLIQDVDPGRLPKTAPQLAIHCYISPQDTVLVAAVSLSRSSVGTQISTNQFNALPGAVVTLTDGNQSVTLKYSPAQGLYQADAKLFPVSAGRTYTLAVTTPDGLNATADATIPAAVPITDVQVDSAAARFEPGITDYFIRLRWRDPAGAPHFYHMTGDNEFGATERIYQGNGQFKEIPYRAVNNLFFSYDSQSPYVTDENQDGQLITSPRGRLSFSYSNGKRMVDPPIIINAYLLNVDENYYRYHEVVRQQSQVSDNPFAEPVLVAGNIQHAFGCFGAYNRSTVTLRIE